MQYEGLYWSGESNDITVVFAHGAGAGPESEFMRTMAENLAEQGLAVLRFEFPYWTNVRIQGKKRPPNPQPVLQEFMQELVRSIDRRPIWLMGKSMGARVAFQVADKVNAVGTVGLGFPFHPPGKLEKTRTPELFNERDANLVVQGVKDPFGKQDWVQQQKLPDNLNLHWVAAANHDLVPNKSAKIDTVQSWRESAAHIAQFIQERT